MRNTALFTLALATAIAAETTQVLDLGGWAQSSLTVKGSDKTATTYTNVCPPASALCSLGPDFSAVVSSDLAGASSQAAAPTAVELTPITGIPTPTAKAKLLARSQTWCNLCTNFEMTQGPSTWAVSIAASDNYGNGVSAHCSFGSGGMEKGASCTSSDIGSSSSVSSFSLAPSDIAEYSLLSNVTVVATSGASSPPTTTGSAAASAASGASGSGSAHATGSAAPSAGLAGAVPVPTAMVAYAGAVVGIFAAAVAL